jgi:hypothetical protein
VEDEEIGCSLYGGGLVACHEYGCIRNSNRNDTDDTY